MRLLMVMALALAPLPAKSQDTFTAYAIGDASCGKYIAETKPQPGSPRAIQLVHSWLHHER